MALGNKNGCLKSKITVSTADSGLDYGKLRFTRLRRKQIKISRFEKNSTVDLSSKRRCSAAVCTTANKANESPLESLPQEILIRLLCGVDHDDLKQLIRVSKTISQATLIAKEWHFAYRTPSKVRAFRSAIEFDNFTNLDLVEAPKAPSRRRFRSLNSEKLASISVALFAEEDESQWPKKKVPIDTICEFQHRDLCK